MPGRFGGVPVEEPKSRFGGVALEDAPAPADTSSSPKPAPTSASASGPSKDDLDAFMKARYSGPNPARNKRQKNDDAGLTPIQIWNRSRALNDVAGAMPGMNDITNAVQQTGQGEYKKALHSAIVGGGKAAAIPFLAPAALMAPGATAAGLAYGALGTGLGYGGAKLMGADEDTANLAGDAAGAITGGLTGHPGQTGKTSRGVARGISENIPIVGKMLKGAWEGAERARTVPEAKGPGTPAEAPKPAAGPAAAPKTAPSAKATAAPEGPKTAPLPVSRQLEAGKPPVKAPPIGHRLDANGNPVPVPLENDKSGVIKGWKPTILENDKAPVPAPVAAAAPKLNTAELDSVVKNLGGKDYASANPTIQKLARDAVAKEAAPVSSALPAKPPTDNKAVTPDVTPGPSNPVEKPEVDDSKPKTVKGMLDAELAAKRGTPAPTPAAAEATPTAPPPDGTPAPAPGDFYRVHGQVKKAISVANDLYSKGITAKDVEGLPLAQRKEALGKDHSPETFSRILFEMRGLETGKVKPTPSGPVAAGTPPPGAKPVTATVRTPGQTKAKVEYKISEAKDLKTSFDPDYNTEIGHQPRDTSRLSSRQRVEARKADMDPESMGHSVTAGDGAPITLDGNTVTRNHGTQALKENYAQNPAKADAYKSFVADNAGLAGMSPDDVAGMKEPILHRELKEDWDHGQVKKFADEANMSSTARMSEPELAKQMSGNLTGSKMGRFKVNDAGVPDADFVRDMIKDLPVEEQNEFQQRNGEISQKGVRLVRNAVFERAYTSTKALESMAESTNPQVKNITNAMLNAAPDFAKLADAAESGDAYDLRVGPEVGRAMETIERLRQEKKSVPDYLKQGDMLGKDPTVQVLLHMFSEESRRPTVIRDTLKNYAQAVFQLGKPNQGGLFGDSQLPSKTELLDEAYKSALKSRASKDTEPSLFGDEAKQEAK